MKQLIILFLFFSSTVLLSATKEIQISFVDFDKKLIDYWYGNFTKISRSCNIENYVALEKEWKEIKNKLIFKSSNCLIYSTFINDINNEFINIDKGYNKIAFTNNVEICYNIQKRFAEFRNKHYKMDYALDSLWDIFYKYQEINTVVDDPLFDLLSWQEFDLLIVQLEDIKKDYTNKIYIQKPKGLNFSDHEELMQKFNECFVHFKDSTLEAFTPDFEIPCDDLGNAILNLLLMHRA